MSTQSEEYLVATVAQELLNNAALPYPVSLERDRTSLKLPCIVVIAKFESEEPDSALPKRYTLTVELRDVGREIEPTVLDQVFYQINNALDPASGASAFIPPTFLASFKFYRIEAGSAGESTQGDTVLRSRNYTVFARLLSSGQANAASNEYNARVPSTAPIQPPQAFVDAMLALGDSGVACMLSAFGAGKGFGWDGNNNPVAILSFPRLTHLDDSSGMSITANPALTTILLQSLIDLSGGPSHISINGNPLLTTILLSSLADLSGFLIDVDINNNASLASISLPLLDISTGGGFLGIYSNPALTNISLPNLADLTSDGGALDFHNNALTQACVNALLHVIATAFLHSATGLSITLDISDGTNAVPTPVHNGTPAIGDFVKNADITGLIAAGGAGMSVTVNEYVNRVSGATEVVTYP